MYSLEKKQHDIPITLYRARSEELDDPKLGWSGYTGIEVKVINVSGDHFSMIKEPFVQEIAEDITQNSRAVMNVVNE